MTATTRRRGHRTAVLLAGKGVLLVLAGELIAAPATPFVAELAAGYLLPGPPRASPTA